MSDQSSTRSSSTPHHPQDVAGQVGGDAAAQTHSEQTQTPAPKRGMRGSAKSMVISLIVVLGVCLVWIAMVPRVSSVSTTVTDLPGIVREHATAQHWDLAVADGLPNGWEPSNVHLLKPTRGPATWQAGYAGPDSAYAAALQTRDGSPSWIADQTGNGKKVGTETIGGVTWTKYQQSSNGQLSLARSTPLAGLTTVVTGTASWEQLKVFAAALVPYSKSAEGKSPAPTAAS